MKHSFSVDKLKFTAFGLAFFPVDKLFSSVFSSFDGTYNRLFGPLFIRKSKSGADYYRNLAAKYLDLSEQHRKTGQQMADQLFLALHYMQMKGIDRRTFGLWMKSKTAKKIMLDEYNRRRGLEAKKAETSNGKA